MSLEIVDYIPAHTLEKGDTTSLEVEGNFTVTEIDDQGDMIVLTGIDEYDDKVAVSVAPTVLVPLLLDVSEDDEDI